MPPFSPKFPEDADQDVKSMKDNATPVEKGNVCTTPAEFLDKAPLEITYQRNFKTLTDTFYQCAFTNTSKDNAKGFLFVSKERLDKFKALDAEKKDGKITFTVDAPEFNYGQKDSKGKNRFLIYSDPEKSSIFQHRFIQGAALKYGTMISSFADGYQEGSDPSRLLASLSIQYGQAIKRF